MGKLLPLRWDSKDDGGCWKRGWTREKWYKMKGKGEWKDGKICSQYLPLIKGVAPPSTNWKSRWVSFEIIPM